MTAQKILQSNALTWWDNLCYDEKEAYCPDINPDIIAENLELYEKREIFEVYMEC